MNKNFNIQLFAENLNTTATMSPEMKTFYEKRLIDQAEPRLVHDQFADFTRYRRTAARPSSSASMTACPRLPLR